MKDDEALVRRFSPAIRQRPVELTIRTDASPFGMGGILLENDGTVLGYWADELQARDLERFGATVGDPAFQSEWEFLAVLISVAVFACSPAAAGGADHQN